MEQARKNLEKLTSHSKQISRQLSQDGSNTPEEDKFMEWAGSPKKGTFRYRRLSFASQGVSSDKDEEESQRIPTSSPPSSDSTFNKPIRRKLYKCPEIEDGPEDEVPFPPSSLGFFSRHGIEPSFSGAFGIAEKINQDRGCIVYPFNHSEEQALFCVFDGHGLNGDLASDFVMKEMVARLEAHPKLNSNPPQALREVYIDVDLAMGDDMEYDKEFNSFVCGTTAVVVYMRGDDMFIANCGDSRAVIGRKKNRLLRSPSAFSSKHQFTAIQLTRDHKPDDSVERARIEKCGGYVTDPPSPGLSGRVWLDIDCSQVGLAMSRSIGDHSVKHVGVVSEPEVVIHSLKPKDEILIMATDGVWEFISSEEAVQIVENTFMECDDENDEFMEDEEKASKASEALIQEATKRWVEEEGDYRDDITVIVLSNLSSLFLPSDITG